MVCEDENTRRRRRHLERGTDGTRHRSDTCYELQGYETLAECYSHSIVEGGFDEMS
jgi:hypothetical protein